MSIKGYEFNRIPEEELEDRLFRTGRFSVEREYPPALCVVYWRAEGPDAVIYANPVGTNVYRRLLRIQGLGSVGGDVTVRYVYSGIRDPLSRQPVIGQPMQPDPPSPTVHVVPISPNYRDIPAYYDLPKQYGTPYPGDRFRFFEFEDTWLYHYPFNPAASPIEAPGRTDLRPSPDDYYIYYFSDNENWEASGWAQYYEDVLWNADWTAGPYLNLYGIRFIGYGEWDIPLWEEYPIYATTGGTDTLYGTQEVKERTTWAEAEISEEGESFPWNWNTNTFELPGFVPGNVKPWGIRPYWATGRPLRMLRGRFIGVRHVPEQGIVIDAQSVQQYPASAGLAPQDGSENTMPGTRLIHSFWDDNIWWEDPSQSSFTYRELIDNGQLVYGNGLIEEPFWNAHAGERSMTLLWDRDAAIAGGVDASLANQITQQLTAITGHSIDIESGVGSVPYTMGDDSWDFVSGEYVPLFVTWV